VVVLRGRKAAGELELEHRSGIIEVLNERFGSDFTDIDKLLFDLFEED